MVRMVITHLSWSHPLLVRSALANWLPAWPLELGRRQSRAAGASADLRGEIASLPMLDLLPARPLRDKSAGGLRDHLFGRVFAGLGYCSDCCSRSPFLRFDYHDPGTLYFLSHHLRKLPGNYRDCTVKATVKVCGVLTAALKATLHAP